MFSCDHGIDLNGLDNEVRVSKNKNITYGTLYMRMTHQTIRI